MLTPLRIGARRTPSLWAPRGRRTPLVPPQPPTRLARALSSASSADGSNPALYGTTEPPLPPPELLACNGLTVEVVPNVGVGSVKYRGAEICRGINFLYRDDGWGTPPLALESSVTVKPQDPAAEQTVSWTSTVQLNGEKIITFDAQVAVGPDPESGSPSLSVNVTAGIIEPCFTSRFGFIVLHPLKNLVGNAVTIIREDGDCLYYNRWILY